MSTWRGRLGRDKDPSLRLDVTRHYRGEEPVSIVELLATITEALGGEEEMCRYGNSVVLSRGYHFRWTSPETDEEAAERAEWSAASEERQEKWERETYVRLREKFGDLR